MPRSQIVIENPILNTPFAEPERHFRFDDEGITDDVVEGRRPSSYFMPIPKAKKKCGQLVFDEWTGDRIEENRLINQIRERIAGGGSSAGRASRPRRGRCSSVLSMPGMRTAEAAATRASWRGGGETWRR